jgi:DNA invertase Pin-like site-specific DNA recombinase
LSEKALQPGNVLVVRKLERLGRDLKHLANTIDELSRREVGFKVLTSTPGPERLAFP